VHVVRLNHGCIIIIIIIIIRGGTEKVKVGNANGVLRRR